MSKEEKNVYLKFGYTNVSGQILVLLFLREP